MNEKLPLPDNIPESAPDPQPLSAEMLQRLLDMAESGDTDAMLRLGEAYDLGIGVSAEPRKALAYYQSAADAGNPEALYQIGVFYITGRHVAKSLDDAAPYLIAAAERGHGLAMNLLALDYSLGGDGKNALRYYDRAARLGIVRSQLALGDLFHTGYRGILSPNQHHSLYWYCQAYLQGSVDAMERLNRFIASPRELQGGMERVQEMLLDISQGAPPPEIRFIEKKKRQFWQRKPRNSVESGE